MLEPNTAAIIAMAWSRVYGLPDDAFVDKDNARLYLAADERHVVALSLLGRTLVRGPQWALDRAVDYSNDSLTELHGLLALAKEHRPRAIEHAELWYADDYVGDASVEEVRVSADPEALRDLLVRCAPDDIDAADFGTREHLFVLLDEDDEPVAAAAYSSVGGILADLAYVEAIDARGTGAVETAMVIAMHDALDAGLVPQVQIDSDGADDVATALGFDRLGSLVIIEVGD